MIHVPVLYLSISLVFLICLSGFFSGSEIGMMSLNRYRLRHLVRKKNRAAKRVQTLLKRPDRLLGVILIGNTFANILASSIATIIALSIWGEYGIAIATILLTLIILIFAEVAPKTLAAMYPVRFALIVSLPLKYLLKVLYPLVWIANVLANSFLKIFGVNMQQCQTDELNSEELRTVVRETAGRLPKRHQDMLLRILDLETITVDDIMVPRNEIIGINLENDWETILKQILKVENSHLPVYKGDIDNLQGVLHIRKILADVIHGKFNQKLFMASLQEPYFIPEGIPLQTQLLNFEFEKRHFALVVNEYGDIEGLVTLADLLEEIVGEFSSHEDSIEREVRRQKDGTYLVDGGANVRELNRLMQWELPTDGPKTVSGMVIEYLEAIPKVGTCIKLNAYPIEVIAVGDNMVKVARIGQQLESL